MNQTDNVNILQAEVLVDQYQNRLSSLNEERQTLNQEQRGEQISQSETDSETRIKQLQENYMFNLESLQQTLQKAIGLSKSFISRDQQCKQLINALDLLRYQSSSKIEILNDETQFLREKLKDSQEHGDKLSGELLCLHDRLNAVDKYYQNNQKQMESEAIAEQSSLQKDGEHYLTELRESNLDLSRVLNLTKMEKSEQDESVRDLKEKVELLTRKLSNTEAKFDWEVQKKEQIEVQLIDRLEDIEHLSSRIDQLQDVLRNPFERLQPDFQSVEMGSEEFQRKSSDQANRKSSNENQVNFQEDAYEYTNSLVNYHDITGSFIHKLVDMGIQLDSTQSANKEEKEETGLINRASLERQNARNSLIKDIPQESQESILSNSGKKLNSSKNDKKSILSKALSIGMIGGDNPQKDHVNKSSIRHIDNKMCPTVLEKRNSFNSIYVKRGVELAVSQTNRSQLKSRVNNNKNPITLDPYYCHFILTSQSVKIQEDIEDMLNIDVKPFYKEIIDKRIQMHRWDQWIRNKLKEVLKELQSAA